MKAIVKIKNNETQLREKNAEASTLLRLLNGTEELTVTDYKKGWYFVKEYSGWVRVIDVIVTQKIEDFDDEDLSNGTNGEDPVNPSGGNVYDAAEIVKCINTGNSNIRGNKIYIIDGSDQLNLETLIKSLNNSLKDIDGVLDKVEAMPVIPALSDMNKEGQILSVYVDPEDNTKLLCGWVYGDYTKLKNIPANIVLAVEW